MWFATFTFKQEVPPERAHRMFFAWLRRLAQALEAKTGCRARVKWILATEWTYAGRVHLHALLYARELDAFPRYAWEARWERVGGGLARIYPAVRKAAPYVTKYIAKDGDITAGILRGVGIPRRQRERDSAPDPERPTGRS